MIYKNLFKQIMIRSILIPALADCSGAQISRPSNHLSSHSVPFSAKTRISAKGDKEWDYVALGDSTQFALIPRYASILEQNLGVKVRVHDWTKGGQSSSELLNNLRNDPKLRQDIQDAEVVTFSIPMFLFKDPAMKLCYGNPDSCGGADHLNCLREALQAYKADTDAILAEMVALRSPSAALMRMMDIYLFQVKDAKKAGVFEVLNQYWQSANEYVIQVAARYSIPVARVSATFMGPNGNEDPMDKGLVVDGFHPTDQGADRIADLFLKLGFEYAPIFQNR